MSIPENEPGNYAYDVWLRQQWTKEQQQFLSINTQNASVSIASEEEENVDVDYQGLLTRVNALSASMGISTTTNPPPKPKNTAALLDLGEKMLFGRRTRP